MLWLRPELHFIRPNYRRLEIGQIRTYPEYLFNDVSHVKSYNRTKDVKSSYSLYYPFYMDSSFSNVFGRRAIVERQLRLASLLKGWYNSSYPQPVQVLADSETSVSHYNRTVFQASK